jgi:hypothetical protein
MTRIAWIACSICLAGGASALWGASSRRTAPARTPTPGSAPRTAPAVPAKPAVASPGPNAPKPSMLERVKELENPKVSPVERARLGLRLYRDELVNPTQIPGPPYVDFRTHDYILAQITETLARVEVDAAPLRAAREGEFAPEIKDCLALYFFLKGEKELKDWAGAYMLDRKHPPRLRELAAKAFGELALKQEDTAAARLLAQVIREDTHGLPRWVRKPKGSDPGQVAYVYPVRRAAAEAIKKMDAANLLLDSYVLAAAEQVQAEVVIPPRRP